MNTIRYVEKITEVANDNGQAMQSILELSLRSMRELGALNGDFLHVLADGAQVPVSGLTLGEQIRRQVHQVEKGSDYFRDVNELLMATQADIGRLHIRRMNDLFDTFQRQLGELVPATRGGSDDVIGALKDGLAQAGAAYEQVFSLSRELLDNSLKSILAAPPPAERAPRAAARKAA